MIAKDIDTLLTYWELLTGYDRSELSDGHIEWAKAQETVWNKTEVYAPYRQSTSSRFAYWREIYKENKGFDIEMSNLALEQLRKIRG